MRIRVVASLLAAFALPGLTEAQSLASLVRSSQRARSGPPPKVYTEADLRAARGRVSLVPPDEQPEPTASPLGAPRLYLGFEDEPAETPAAGPTAEEARAERRAELQRLADEQARVMEAVSQAMAEAQVELNDLSQLTFGGRRAYLVQIVEDGQRELAKARQALADLEDQARRDGFYLSR